MRRLLAVLVACLVSAFAGVAWSGSYLDRSAVLLDASRLERDMVWPRSSDKELLKVVHAVAKARTEVARDMQIPKAIVPAHPHLLLTLENTERAYAAALKGNHQKFLEHIVRARAEDKAFRAIVRKLGYSLPKTK